MKNRKTRALRRSGALCAGLAAVAACGTGGGSASSTGRGPITYVAGADNTGTVRAVLDRWNKLHPGEKVTFVQLPTDPDAQRQQMIQNAATRSDAFTVLSLDVVWTSEFAAHRWVDRLPEDRFPLGKMLKPIVATGMYRGGLYSVPASSDGGMLYYRTDLLQQAKITRPPVTWAELKADCAKVRRLPAAKGVSCYAGQFQKYEGLTVNAAEAINSAGGVITDDQGKPNVNTPQAKAGLDFLVNGFKNGYIAKEALTYKEEEARRAFQEGKLIFERQWPYMYSKLVATDGSSQVNGKFAVAPLPGMSGPGVSSLGGHAKAVSAFSKNKKTALDFIKFFTSKENNQKNFEQASQAPVYTAIYDDAALQSKYPYLATLKQSILTAKPRPKVVRYGDATLAIQDAAYGALQGNMTSDQALQQLQTKLEQLITG